MQKFQFTKIDSILSKFQRDFRGLDINEGDAIEWIGEALGFMKIVSASEEAIAFIEVKNFHAPIPNGLHYITQIARNNNWEKPADTKCCMDETLSCLTESSEVVAPSPVTENCQGELSPGFEIAYYRPFFDLQYEYLQWASSKARATQYSPVRLANHTFFNTLVCKEENMEHLYCQGCDAYDEYTIVQDQLRFNFESGFIAVAYIRQMIDDATGYPMIPDDESARAAITYYLGWKVKEQEGWNHREGSMQLAQLAEAKWLKYIKQFKSKAKMPTGVDQYQNLMEQSKYLIPRQNRYYGFFGKLGRAEDRPFNDPNQTNRYAAR